MKGEIIILAEIKKEDFVSLDPEVLHGTPVFKGTRVPIETLFDYLSDSESINDFLDDFPSVKKEQVTAVKELYADVESPR